MSMIKRALYSKVVKGSFIALNRLLLGLFFDRKYLRGKYFDEKLMGWLWAWRGVLHKLIGFNRRVPWPISPLCHLHDPKNIEFDQSSINIFQSPGCYFQNFKGKIFIGKGVYIAPNVGIITSNHDPSDLDSHQESRDVHIGDNCWIGMNSVVLPGVELGPNTMVGAVAAVTKSFKDGHCIIGGVPAKVIKLLEKE